MLAWHSTGSPTAAVPDDNFASDTVQLISAPAGKICLAACATNAVDSNSVQRAT